MSKVLKWDSSYNSLVKTGFHLRQKPRVAFGFPVSHYPVQLSFHLPYGYLKKTSAGMFCIIFYSYLGHRCLDAPRFGREMPNTMLLENRLAFFPPEFSA